MSTRRIGPFGHSILWPRGELQPALAAFGLPGPGRGNIFAPVGHATKLLFVCSRNHWRSPTAERLFDGVNGCRARSAGTEDAARVRVTAGHIGWADRIFVMEKKHLSRLRARFGDALDDKPVICLHIPDDYEFMQPELVTLLEAAVTPHFADA